MRDGRHPPSQVRGGLKSWGPLMSGDSDPLRRGRSDGAHPDR